jgi:hypothetical protein
MGLFDRFKKAPQVATNSFNMIYELLFCDNIDLYKLQNQHPGVYPWNILFAENSSNTELQKIIDDTGLETRAKILAYNKLRTSGQIIDKKELLGVIVEVGMDEGLDVLASFKDGTARYLNHSGSMIIWETTDATSNELTNKLFADSLKVVQQIGPWDKPRCPQPPGGNARISFLVSDGLYFGEAPLDTLFSDPLAAHALQAATALMQYITERATQKTS